MSLNKRKEQEHRRKKEAGSKKESVVVKNPYCFELIQISETEAQERVKWGIVPKKIKNRGVRIR